MMKFLSFGRLPLLMGHQLPPDLREIAILGGYRPLQSTPRQCLQSVFFPTNETINVWTHLIPSMYFMWKLVTFCYSLDVSTTPYTWAFVAYMVTACTYPFVSAMAHTFYVMSTFARKICFFLDYGALSFYSFGVGLLYRAYAFPDTLLESQFCDIFLLVCLLNALMSTVIACSSRFFTSRILMKLFRFGAFSFPWVWDNIPLIYRLAHADQLQSVSEVHYMRQLVFSVLIGFLYTSHLPERLAPGKFDIVGHSHQLLHICGVLATTEQINGALYDLKVRREVLQVSGKMVCSSWSVGAVVFLFFVNAGIIAMFTRYAWKSQNNKGELDKDR